jgi:hypothetical protein
MIPEKAIILASVFMLILCLSTTPIFLSQLWIVTVCCLEEIQKADEHIETALGQI